MTRAADSRSRRRSEERRIAEEQSARWASELATRYAAAGSLEERARLLAEMDRPYTLDEAAALVLYVGHPELASGFIQRHLPRGRRAEDVSPPWQQLMAQALAGQDIPLYFALYRIQAPAEQWSRDSARLAEQTAEPERLIAELERRHPQRWRPDVGVHLAVLALRRGKDLLPYLLAHAADVWSPRRRDGYEQMIDLARRHGWWELWGLLLRAAGTAAEYDREVLALVEDVHAPEADTRQRLWLLAGVDAAVELPARFKQIRETTLAALYQRFPDLAREAFQAQIEPTPQRPLTGLLQLAIARHDDALIDALAARLAVRVERSGAERLLRTAALAEEYLRTCGPDPVTLGRRVVSILTRISPSAMRAQRELLRRNPLTRLLLDRAADACLASSEAAAELLQAANPHVRALAVRMLAGNDARGSVLAQQHLEILLGCLERALPRTAARQAIRVLDRIADQPARAQRVAQWARGMLERSHWSGPKEELAGLLGRQLARFPLLRQTQEQPVVYRREAA